MTDAARRVRRLLYAAAFLRALAVGMIAVLIGIYCARLGFSPTEIGIVLSAALWGAALAAVLTTLGGPRVAERPLLVVLTALPVIGGAVVIAADSVWLVAAAAFAGMLNVNGRDRGAIPILEQAMFPATVAAAGRTRVFAWYNVLLDAGYAVGGLLAALPTLLETMVGLDPLSAMKLALGLFCLLYAAAAMLYAQLPRRVGTTAAVSLAQLTPASRPIVKKISALFLLDAIAGGLIGSAIFAYWFAEAFGAAVGTIALLFALGRVLSALSHIAAAWLAQRIGLVNTMVFTHLPSSLLLFTIVATDDFVVAAALFLLREALAEMDVPTRQSYVMAVVQPQERLTVAGITSVVRSGGWALAPVFAGAMMQSAGLGVPLVLAGIAKISYDLMLWRAFRQVRPPEEHAPAAPPGP